jgi:Mg2+-importing ATPase
VVTARALAITARDSDTRSPGTAGLKCEESVLTGESLPAERLPRALPAGTPLAELSCCALTGTVGHAGSGAAVAAASGGEAESGRIALGPGEHQPETDSRPGCAGSP